MAVRTVAIESWTQLSPALLTIGAPSAILMLDRAKDKRAPELIKKLGIPALILFIIVLAYSGATSDPLLSLLTWGAVGGLLATVALDAVRLLGVRLRAFPLDMPVMFGLMSLGVAPKLPKHVMANMVAMLAELPDDKRRQMLEPRVKAMADLSPAERRLFMSMMQNGLGWLSEDKRQRVLKTQIEILASLSEEKRAAMMRTMDELMFGMDREPLGSVNPVSPMPIFRAGRMPKLPMATARELLRNAIPQVVSEHGTSVAKVKAAGYLWHLINGATYGIGFTLLFGMGSWPWAFAWGLFLDLVMMVGMPPMMPMIRLPFPRFLVVPYFAHLAMAVPIGYFALTFITPEATRLASLLGPLLPAGDTYLTLTVAPFVAFIILTAIILGGYKAYTKPIYGKGWP